MLVRAKKNGWNVFFAGDAEIENFMTMYYPNTSTLWAYNMIHPQARVATADIWRYAALFAFGGFYIDDDANFQTDPDQVIRPSDTLILSTESNPYNNICYSPQYRLSDEHMAARHHHNSSFRAFFGGRYLLNWAMFAAPGHPLLLQVLEQLVDVVRREFLAPQSALRDHQQDPSRDVVCATGPGLLTATARLALLRLSAKQDLNGSSFTALTGSQQLFRLEDTDFKALGGKFKTRPSSRSSKELYYRSYMQVHHTPLLRQYHNSSGEGAERGKRAAKHL